MIVTSSGVVIAGLNRIIINDSVNEFLGTVNDQWTNAANWSLGVVPVANHIVRISNNCIGATGTIRSLYVNDNISLGLNVNAIFSITSTFSNLGSVSRASGNGNRIEITQFKNSDNLGLINIASASNLTLVPIEDITDLSLQISSGSSINVLTFSGTNTRVVVLKPIISTITNTISTNGMIFHIPENLTIGTIGGGGNPNTIRLADGVKLEANIIDHAGNASGILCEGNNEIIIKGFYRVSYGYQIPIEVPVIFRANSNLLVQNIGVNTYVHNIIVDNVVTTTVLASGVFTLFNSKITGTSPTSEFILSSGCTWNFLGNTGSTTEDLMSTGILTQQSGSTLNYSLAGNQYIKPIAYKQLGIMTSGVKYLKGNTTCEHLYFGGTATLDTSGYTLSGYTKYTDNSTVNRTFPSGTFDTVTIGGQSQGMKTLSGNITCNIFDFYTSSLSYINYNGFTISATTFNDTFNVNNMTSHVGGTRNNVRWTSDGTVNLSSPMTITGTLEIGQINSGVNISGSTLTLASGSTTLYNRQSSSNLTLGIGTFYNLNLAPLGGAAVVTRTLVQNIVVTGTFTLGATVTLNKNGFTIVDGSGNPLA